jgi:uncharacterized membrane protein
MDPHGLVVDLHPAVDMHTGWAAYFINSHGDIFGVHTLDSSIGGSIACLWKNGNFVDLPTSAPWKIYGYPHGFNDRDQAVGVQTIYDDAALIRAAERHEPIPQTPVKRTNHAVLWQDDKFLDLNDLSDAPKDCLLETAFKINNNGWIIGVCVQNNKRTGFLLTPLVPQNSL